MGDYPTQRNLGLAPMDYVRALAPRLHADPVGPAYGRYTPYQTETVGMRILAQVAQDVFAADDAGIAYPAGQLWVRTYSLSTSMIIGNYDTDFYWVAVPDTLPAGYTAVPWRNNVGAGGFGFELTGAFQLDDGHSPQIFYPNFTPSKPIRLADGPYTPKCITVDPVSGTRRFIAGPCNIRGAVGSIDFGAIGGGFSGQYISYHPGWRNVKIQHAMTPTAYAAAGGGDAITATLDGIGFTVHKSDFVLSGGIYRAATNTGPIAMAAVGEVQRMSVAVTASGGLTAATFFFDASPRVDIPAPFWSSYGNLVAPGGIAAGTVPGY